MTYFEFCSATAIRNPEPDMVPHFVLSLFMLPFMWVEGINPPDTHIVYQPLMWVEGINPARTEEDETLSLGII